VSVYTGAAGTAEAGKIVVELIPYDNSQEVTTNNDAGYTGWRDEGYQDGLMRNFKITKLDGSVTDALNGTAAQANGAFTYLNRDVPCAAGKNPCKKKVIFTPTAALAVGDIITFPTIGGNLIWMSPQDNNIWNNSNITSGWQFTYGGDCAWAPQPAPVATPTDVVINGNILTFTSDANAASNTVFVYINGILVHQQENFTSGDVINFTSVGEYTVKVRSVGDNNMYLNSDFSEAVAWVIAGTPDPLGDSEYCHQYWNPIANNLPGGEGGNSSDLDAVILTWETLADGKITVTLGEVNGNAPVWRETMPVANFQLGPLNTAGTGFLTTAINGNVCTITPVVEFPQGLQIKYNGNFSYRVDAVFPTEGYASPTNLYPKYPGGINYTYGTDCSNIVVAPLATPENVSVDIDGKLQLDPVDNAGAYVTYIYVGGALLYSQANMQIDDVVNFPLQGTFDVRVSASPAVTDLSVYGASEQSEVYVWTIAYNIPATIPASVYCGYVVHPTGGNAPTGVYADYADSYWSWKTDVDGNIVLTIDSCVHSEYNETAKFRANGMGAASFKINGLPATRLLDKVGGNTGTTQTFKAKAGVELVPGYEITFAGQTEYFMAPGPKPADEVINGNIHDLYPNLTFATPYIYGSNCTGEVTVLSTPTITDVTGDVVTFDAVTGAASYTLYIYNAVGEVVATQENFDGTITYENPGRFTVKIKAIGDGVTTLTSPEFSNGEEWVKIATLATPSIVKISTLHNVTIGTVPSAISYTVFVYAAGDLTTAVRTITDFEDGDVIDMETLGYGEYVVKIQAIGDGDVILDSEVSAAFNWTYAEPYDCNLFLQTEPKDHTLNVGSNAFTWTNQANEAKDGAPYFAPGWTPSNDYTVTLIDDTIRLHLGAATAGDWQAQFRFFPTEKIINKQGGLYDIAFKVETNKSTPVYVKWFEFDDNSFVEFARETVESVKTYSREGTTLNSNIFQILFDFGGNPANTDITITGISICGEEGIELGIKPINENTLVVYPNPTTDMLYISNTSAKEARIINILGSVINVPVQNGTINVAGLAQGIYFLNIDNQTVKFIKK
jgi:hypothetical protein